MVTFETAFREQILSRKQTRRAKRILAILDAPPSRRRTRQIARMERHAAAAIEHDGARGAIDWGAVDWGKFFDTILQFIMAILPLLMMISIALVMVVIAPFHAIA